MALISATGAEAGLSTVEQLEIALRFIVSNGGEALMKDIDGAVEVEMNARGYTLSQQGHDTLRELVNRNAVQRGWIHKSVSRNTPWRISPEGQAHITASTDPAVGASNAGPALDIAEPGGPSRACCTTYRILRDTPLAKKVKAEHNHACQVCGNSLQLLNTQPYAEAHHIRPLGSPHHGPDLSENILCLCPNCHVLLDYGAIELDITHLSSVREHRVGEEYVEYHNMRIFGRILKPLP